MSILSRLTLKSLRLNSRRSISTMLGIILSTALICAACTMGTSLRGTLVEEVSHTNGYYHIRLDRISEEDRAALAENRDFLQPHTARELGCAVLEGCKNPDKPYTKIWAMDEDTFSFLSFQLIDGHFPEHEDEIVISRHMLTNGHMDLGLGDTLTLEVGERQTVDGEPLDYDNAYEEGGERIAGAESGTYRIVGIIERPDMLFETYSDPCYTTIVRQAGQDGRLSAFLTLKNPYHYKEAFGELLNITYSEVKSHQAKPRFENYRINEHLLRWECFSVDDDTMKSMVAVLAIVVGIIILTSIFCIRNSFAISTTEKIRMYGMLASVGATRKQIRRCVLREGFFLGIIAVPAGIISGLLADYVLVAVINRLMPEMFHVKLVLSVSGLVVMLSVMLGFLTIYGSAIASARTAEKVSPIGQLRNVQDIRQDEKELQIPKWVKKVFHTGGVLAYKNLKRSRRKYRTTVVSLAVSIFTFITMNVFLENMFLSTDEFAAVSSYDLVLSANDDGQTETDVLEILRLERVREAVVTYGTRADICISDRNRLVDPPSAEQEYVYPMPVIALDDASFRAYAENIGADYNKVRGLGILCDNALIELHRNNGETVREKRKIFNYRADDLIEGYYYPGGSFGGKPIVPEEERVPYSIRVGAVTDRMPYESRLGQTGTLYLNRDYADPGFHFYFSSMMVRSDDPDPLENEIIKAYPMLTVRNYARDEREQRSVIIIIAIFLYGFITVITLIGVTNIFNTITSNMELRQKEFAMLKSVGMTKGEFNRMIRLETLFYCTKALLYGVVFGLLGTFALYRAFQIALTSSVYIPVSPILISAGFVFVFVFLIMKYSLSKLGRQNIIETIRNENI